MERFRRLSNELVLESEPTPQGQYWASVRKNSLRSGVMNAPAPKDAYKLHKLLLSTAPNYLSISPLDIDYLELMFGFDLLATGNHDAIVFDALVAGSPLAAMLDVQGGVPVDCQPLFVMAVDDTLEVHAQFEVKTRTHSHLPKHADLPPDPISVYLTMRRYGPVDDVASLTTILDTLALHGEKLVMNKVVPNLLVPIREQISAR